jgi:hypothetical protein
MNALGESQLSIAIAHLAGRRYLSIAIATGLVQVLSSAV